MKRVHFAAALAVLLGAVGCFDYDEEVWLDRSGSGRAAITIRMPEQLKALAQSAASLQAQGRAGPNPLAGIQTFRFSREEAEKPFANRPGIRVVKVDEVKEAGMVGYRIELTFDSLSHLEQALSSRQQNGLPVNGGGKLSLVENGRSFQFHRQIGASKTGSGSRAGSRSPADQTAEGMAAIFFANHYLTYRYHFPFPIKSANAAKIDPKTNTVEWKFGLADVMAGDLDMHAELTARPPAWVFVVLAVATAGAAALIVLRYRAVHRRTAPVQPASRSPEARQTAPRFQTREEYESWKMSQRPEGK
jgi:hypothetical protein